MPLPPSRRQLTRRCAPPAAQREGEEEARAGARRRAAPERRAGGGVGEVRGGADLPPPAEETACVVCGRGDGRRAAPLRAGAAEGERQVCGHERQQRGEGDAAAHREGTLQARACARCMRARDARGQGRKCMSRSGAQITSGKQAMAIKGIGKKTARAAPLSCGPTGRGASQAPPPSVRARAGGPRPGVPRHGQGGGVREAVRDGPGRAGRGGGGAQGARASFCWPADSDAKVAASGCPGGGARAAQGGREGGREGGEKGGEGRVSACGCGDIAGPCQDALAGGRCGFV